MAKRRIESPLLHLTAALAICLLLVVGSSLLAARASAGPLDGVTGPVNEVTAPVKEAVETVVPPVVTTPPPAPQPPPPVKLPEVQVPEVPANVPAPPPVKAPPVKIPAPPAKVPSAPPATGLPSVPAATESAKHTVEAATGTTTTKAAGTVTSTGKEAAGAVQKTGGTVGGTAEKTVDAATAGPRKATGPSTTGSGGPTDAVQSSPARANAAGADSGAGAGSNVSRSMPQGSARSSGAPVDLSLAAKVLTPFIHIWPAVALLEEGRIGDFVGTWSQTILALFEEGAPGALQGEGGVLAASEDGLVKIGHPASSSSPFSDFWSPSHDAMPVLFFFLLIGVATLVLFGVMRREVGEPLLPRRMTRWRR
jgi:hypothetical protein